MKLSSIFSDGMVLQRDENVNIFGESDVDELIRISIDDISVEQECREGRWIIALPSHSAGGPYTMTVSSPDNEIIIHDVYYGEVWLNNGQSNIELELEECAGGSEEIRTADYPEIRFYKVFRTGSSSEADREEENCSWVRVSGSSFGQMSGVGYYYSRILHSRLNVPIGMIDCYQGGTSITCWLEEDVIRDIPEISDYIDGYDRLISEHSYDELRQIEGDYETRLQQYLSRLESLGPNPDPEEIVEKAGAYPWPPPTTPWSIFRPYGIVDTMLKRVTPFTIRGVVYYQGEEDTLRNLQYLQRTGRNIQYTTLLTALVKQYREFFMKPELPFVIFQLPMFIEAGMTDDRDWGYLRLAQEQAAEKDDNIYLTSLVDMGEYNNVHPVDKKTPGERLADTMMNNIYGDSGSDDMLLSGYRRDGDCLVLELSNTYGRVLLMNNGLSDLRRETPDCEYCADHIYGLEVSNDMKEWSVPDAYLRDDEIVIKNAGEIKYVQYGIFNYGRVNIYNNKYRPLKPYKINLDSDSFNES